jgi:hypothetical protein
VVRRETEFALEIGDWSIDAQRYSFPAYVITAEDWPTTFEEEIGRKAPLVYGTFAGVEVPQIATGGIFMIGQQIQSVTGGRVDASSSTPALTNKTAADGTLYAELDYSVSTQDKTCTVDGTGPVDDADGTYTGVANALLTHAADQLHHLARTLKLAGGLELPVEKVDVPSFVTLREKFLGYLSTIVIGADDSVNYFRIASTALMPFLSTAFVERGLLRAASLDFDAMPVMHLRDKEILLGTEEFEWQGYTQVPAGIEIKYNRVWSGKKKQYVLAGVAKVLAEDYPPFAKAKSKGAVVLKLELPYVKDAATIEAMLVGIKTLHSKNRRRVSLRVGREGHDLRLFQNIEWTAIDAPSRDGEGVAAKRLAILGITPGTDESTLHCLEC